MRPLIDLTGKRFGYWTVLRRSGRPHYWITKCDCGTIKDTLGRTLRYGTSTNCGCAKLRGSADRSRIHGKSGTSLYFAWNNMKGRCTKPSRRDFDRYGGRGIGFADEWAKFVSFEHWAEQNGYREGLTLKLIDKNADYGPDNCHWVRRSRPKKCKP